jgi:hypothetical protein
MFFLWDDWNIEHIARHGVEPHEAQYIIRHARRPWPRSCGTGKFIVKGPTVGHRLLQTVFVFRNADQIDLSLLLPAERLALLAGEQAFYVIHAREIHRTER